MGESFNKGSTLLLAGTPNQQTLSKVAEEGEDVRVHKNFEEVSGVEGGPQRQAFCEVVEDKEANVHSYQNFGDVPVQGVWCVFGCNEVTILLLLWFCLFICFVVIVAVNV